MKTKITITEEKEIDIKYLKLEVFPRYWEDSEVNGSPDIDFYETRGEGTPKMPCAEKTLYRSDFHKDFYKWCWTPIINVETGQIINWTEGTTANIHYKVCDEGTYILLDENKNEIKKIESYVPDCIGEYGDYIVMNIDEKGFINNFHFSANDVKDMIDNAF